MTVSPRAMNQAIDNTFVSVNPTVNSPGQKFSAYNGILQYLTRQPAGFRPQ